jgi:hypothetical protein
MPQLRIPDGPNGSTTSPSPAPFAHTLAASQPASTPGRSCSTTFQGSAVQVQLLLGILSRLAADCKVTAVQLALDETVRQQRIRDRRVCHSCENDPARDSRLPATPTAGNPWSCARCGGILHPLRADAPCLLAARTARYEHEAPGLRQAFAEAGIQVIRMDAARPAADLAAELTATDLP